MITDRQVVERSYRANLFVAAVFAIMAATVILYQLLHWMAGLGPELPNGLLTFSLLALPSTMAFYAFSRLIHWIVLGFVSDKERRAKGPLS